MSATTLPIKNTSTTHPLRVLLVAEGSTSEPQATAIIQPLAVEKVLLHESRRVILETPSPDEISIEISNLSLYCGLKLSTSEKTGGKFGEPTLVGYLAAARNGERHSTVVTASAKRRAILQQLPT